MSSSTFIPTVNLSVQEVDMQTYWQLYTLQFYLLRMQSNLAILNAPPNALIIQVMNTNLYILAAKYYNDATQWPIIANANNLIDPQIYAPKTLIIPPWNQQDTGGIL